MTSRTIGLSIVAATALLGAGLAAPSVAASGGAVVDTGDSVVITGDTYRMRIVKDGFRYSFETMAGAPVAPAHAESGLRVKSAGASDFADAEDTRLVSGSGAAVAVLDVTLSDGAHVPVHVRPSGGSARISVPDLPGDGGTVDFRTGPVAPAYGLGDYGAQANGQPDQGTPCSGNVEARPTTELTGIVLDNLTNEGSCKRFISNFTIFPKQRLGQVWFEDGQKRVGLTGTENRLGAAGVDDVKGLYYFVGRDLPQVYANYKQARERHGYHDGNPRSEMFELGWEAYGALGWGTYQSSVTETLEGFLDRGYPLRWGIVGSGFWPGPRGNKIEGTTNSFGMWDDTFEPGRKDSQPGLPNPRYPDPAGLKSFFRDNGLALLLGARINFKALADDGGNYYPQNDGPFVEQARDAGYLLTDDDGSPMVVSRAQFPAGASYMLDGTDPAAVDWFADQLGTWGVDGWKEDTMVYEPNLHRDGNWNPVLRELHERGDYMISRNAAYSLPGDIIRIQDTIFGTGEVYHEDPDLVPVNILNYAASGVANVQPDYVGGTPGFGSMTHLPYQRYFVRNAQMLAVSPVMAFGKGPWELGRPDLAAGVKKLALWHDTMHPYIYDAALDGYSTGYPAAMTPLPIAFPDDETTYGLANNVTHQYEWMVGESLLAAPVFGDDFTNAESRDVYLPAGKWIDIETGATFQGPVMLDDYAIGADRVPAFVGGKGTLVERQDGRLTAAVYPVSTGSTYSWTDGAKAGRITNGNSGWDPESLVVTDTTSGRAVPYTVDEKTGALRFSFAPGHDYELTGGGDAPHPFPVETTAPATPQAPSHTVAQGLTTLSWAPVAGARSYVVTAAGRPASCTPIVGSTAGETSLVLGAPVDSAGDYQVTAVSSAGHSAPSESHTVPMTGPVSAVLTVTDEDLPNHCHPAAPRYVETGDWKMSYSDGFDGTDTRAAANYGATKSATWHTDLEPGRYEVAIWYPTSTNGARDATFRVGPVVGAPGGTLEFELNQRTSGGEWRVLGTFDFAGDAPDKSPFVAAVTGSTGGSLRTDAVRFTRISP